MFCSGGVKLKPDMSASLLMDHQGSHPRPPDGVTRGGQMIHGWMEDK